MNKITIDYNIEDHNYSNNYDRGNLLTEKNNSNSEELDILNTNDLVKLFTQEDLKPQKAIFNSQLEITRAVDEITLRLDRGGKLFYIGAGTSGRLGVLDASECPPTFCTNPELVQGIIAGGYESLYKSSESIEDNNLISIHDLKNRNFSSNDCLIGITAGGTTPYVLSALKYSQSIGSLSIAIACVPTQEAFIPCDIDIRLITGPEIITGSTRLKAGTATKMALNIISSCVMIKLGKVYKNRMVDLSATNDKLIDRSIRILNDLTGLNRSSCRDLLRITDGSVKVALLVSFANIKKEDAKKILSENGGNLRKSLESLGLN